MGKDYKNGSSCWYSAELFQMTRGFWRWRSPLWSFSLRDCWRATARSCEKSRASNQIESPHVKLGRWGGLGVCVGFWNKFLSHVSGDRNTVSVSEIGTPLSPPCCGLPGAIGADLLALMWMKISHIPNSVFAVPICRIRASRQMIVCYLCGNKKFKLFFPVLCTVCDTNST